MNFIDRYCLRKKYEFFREAVKVKRELGKYGYTPHHFGWLVAGSIAAGTRHTLSRIRFTACDFVTATSDPVQRLRNMATKLAGRRRT